MTHSNNKYLGHTLVLTQLLSRTILEDNRRTQWVKIASYLGILYNPNDPVTLYFGDEKSFLFSLMPKYQLFMSTFDAKSK